MPIRRRDFLKLSAAAIPCSFNPAWANPETLRIIVPFAAGSGLDGSARVFAEALRAANGGTFIVENKGGGATVVGTQEVARSKPDGSTILYTTAGHVTNPALIKNLPYDPVTSFTPITMLVRGVGFALIVAENSPYKTLQEFVAAARAKPGTLSYGSSGNGNTTHVIGSLFCRSAGIDMLHVPFKATPLTDLLAGTIDSLFVSPSLITDFLKSGKMRALGISAKKRLPDFPDTATFNEIGVDAEVSAWSGFWGPAKMPADIVQSVYQRLSRGAQHPIYTEYVARNGGDIVLMPPGQFAQLVAQEVEHYKKLLPELGIKVD